MIWEINFSTDSQRQLALLTARNRRIVLDAIRDQLSHQPTVETRNRKLLQPNPVAEWELRVDQYRVFYNVEESKVIVLIVAIGVKDRNILMIEGKETQL